MFKDEAGGKIIKSFVGLRSKLYSLKIHDGDEDKKCEESPCPSGTTSLNGYTPNCFAQPPKMYKQPLLYLEETYSGFYLLCVFEYPEYQNVTFDVIWSSEKDDLHRETLFESRNATLPGEMVDVNHLLIYCKITAMFIYPDGTAKSTPSPAISSRSILLSVEELQSPENDTTVANISRNRLQETSNILNNSSLPIAVSVGTVVLLLLLAAVIFFVIRKNRIRARSKLFLLDTNRDGLSETYSESDDENNCNTML
ncbi:uncharacterized protein LOC117124111 [Anneissia japonica]|uniref:uncharacterized protein LOC117124111 n=1 Tax=Anneissia japonica TaxID=1529436 RepID=UPI001425AC79|nr:uncharacterized protein LOC117124111 [Anneissia japonica]